MVTLAGDSAAAAAATLRGSLVIVFGRVGVCFTSLSDLVELRSEVVFELFGHEAAHNEVKDVVKDDCESTGESNYAPDRVVCLELPGLNVSLQVD